jgi:hypothetical protein
MWRCGQTGGAVGLSLTAHLNVRLEKHLESLAQPDASSAQR